MLSKTVQEVSHLHVSLSAVTLVWIPSNPYDPLNPTRSDHWTQNMNSPWSLSGVIPLRTPRYRGQRDNIVVREISCIWPTQALSGIPCVSQTLPGMIPDFIANGKPWTPLGAQKLMAIIWGHSYTLLHLPSPTISFSL